MSKKIFILSVLFLAVTFTSVATAGISVRDDVPDALQDTPYYFVADLNWTPVQNDMWEFSGTYWNGKVELTDCGATSCKVTWEFQHLIAPHPPEETSPGPLFSQYSIFNNNVTGWAVDEAGNWTHTNGTDSEVWTFDIGLDNTYPENNSILLTVTHAPEPISSTLFIVGGATLGFRRFQKKIKLHKKI